MEKFIIDRIEGTYAVCETENKTFVNINVSELPADIHEGACILHDECGFKIDSNTESERSARINNLMNSLFKK